ncbi:MAG: GLPGLI family protein [Chryseobacterium sp.]|jgi:GLPGLI family protein|uniref:GLPGLI family protein n=1 Tax=Chryseobacterium sp. TaxID=1871047 RepID=UPI00281D026F|nr:GLPGLI family protein [Chryseobacterium sp.]MDR2234823.1 GLPGLI family protein [Chryseobacterium sp.]
MKITTTLFLLISGILLCQNQRFVYEYSFKLDTLHQDTMEKEMMNLDITKDGSYFYSALLLTRDSLFNAEVEKGKLSNSINIDFRKIKQPKVNFRISKKYPGLETVYHTLLNASNVAVKESNKISWTVLPETKSIEGFKTQKAITRFGGRNWTAWFTTDIQIQDGPYKFCGLPGLILYIEDEQETHIFKLAGSQKFNEAPSLIDSKIKETFVTKEKFNQLWSEYIKDPAKNIKLMHSSSQMSETLLFDSNTGSPMTKQDLIRNKEKRAKEFLTRFNNFIEKDLYR